MSAAGLVVLTNTVKPAVRSHRRLEKRRKRFIGLEQYLYARRNRVAACVIAGDTSRYVGVKIG